MKLSLFLLLPLVFGVMVLLPSSTSSKKQFQCVACGQGSGTDRKCVDYKEGDTSYYEDCDDPPSGMTNVCHAGFEKRSCWARNKDSPPKLHEAKKCGSDGEYVDVTCYCEESLCNNPQVWPAEKGTSAKDGDPPNGSSVGSSFGFLLLLGISLLLLQ